MIGGLFSCYLPKDQGLDLMLNVVLPLGFPSMCRVSLYDGLGKPEYVSIFSIDMQMFDSFLSGRGYGFASCHCIRDPLTHLAASYNFLFLFWS